MLLKVVSQQICLTTLLSITYYHCVVLFQGLGVLLLLITARYTIMMFVSILVLYYIVTNL
jgi:hypothetical protein